jgi:transcriptional repressor NrdR
VHCPFCGSASTRVLETRGTRRRRECSQCGNRFTTVERVESAVEIVKRDGRKERFDRQKLLSGLRRAAGGRPVTEEQLEALTEEIAAAIRRRGPEARAEEVGELALQGLARIDPVTGIQFASVYRRFGDLDELEAEVRRLRDAVAVPSDPESSIGLSPTDSSTDRRRGHARQP